MILSMIDEIDFPIQMKEWTIIPHRKLSKNEMWMNLIIGLHLATTTVLQLLNLSTKKSL